MPHTNVETRIAQAHRSVRGASERFDPLMLLHLSDIHGDGPALARVLNWASDHKALIDDIVVTGDLTHLQFSDGMDHWTQVEGSERVLTCVGNHDVYDNMVTPRAYDQVRVVDAAARYIDPFVSAWGNIDHTMGTTWYAKDYLTRAVRLIVLDCMVYLGVHSASEAAEQNVWLEGALADAREKGLTVVIAEHFPLADHSMIDCSWATFDRAFAYGRYLSDDVTSRVQAFIDVGGVFACYLCGHCHCDAVHTLPGHPEQFALTVPCATDDEEQCSWGDMDRTQPSTRDAFDLVFIDTANGLVKAVRIGADRDLALQRRTTFSWDYRRHRLVNAD